MAEIPLIEQREQLKSIMESKIKKDGLSAKGLARYERVSRQIRNLSTVDTFVLSDQQVGKLADEIFSLVFLNKNTDNLAKIRKNAAEIISTLTEYNEMKKAKLDPQKRFSEMNVREIFDKLRCWCHGKWKQDESNMIIRVVNLEKLRVMPGQHSWEWGDKKDAGRKSDWRTAEQAMDEERKPRRQRKMRENYAKSDSSDEEEDEMEDTCQLDASGKIEFLSDQGIEDFTVSFNEKKYKLILDNVVDQDDISSLSSRILPLNDSRINEELRALRGCTNKYQLRQFLSLKRFAEWFIDSIIQEVEVCLWSDYEEETTEENEEEVKEMTYEEYEILEGIQVGNVVELNSDIFEEETEEDLENTILLKLGEELQAKLTEKKGKYVNYLDTRVSTMSQTPYEKIRRLKDSFYKSDSSEIGAKWLKLSIGDYDLKAGRQIILEFISLWKLKEGWCYCVNFMRRETDSTSDYYFYEVKWSRPTIDFPVPVASVSVLFTIEVSRIIPLKCPVNVTYVFEGTSCVHEFDELKEPEKFLWEILMDKLRLCKIIGHLKIF